MVIKRTRPFIEAASVPQAAKSAFWWAIAFVLVGIFEESFSRGYAQATLMQGIGFWPAAIVNSLIFAAIHLTNDGESILGILSLRYFSVSPYGGLAHFGLLWVFTRHGTTQRHSYTACVIAQRSQLVIC
jgi:membrane protease YdiL (CAAX protease family)